MFKRLSNRACPYTHSVTTQLVKDGKPSAEGLQSDEYYLLARKLLADLPMVPDATKLYALTDELRFGLLDNICALEDVDAHWDECLDATANFLKNTGFWVM